MAETSNLNLVKRRWCYVQKPSVFELAPCECGNTDTQWSEFDKHIWCEKCQKDFIPEHGGIFDSPIAINTAALLGISFDRINLETNKVEKFDMQKLTYEKSHG